MVDYSAIYVAGSVFDKYMCVCVCVCVHSQIEELGTHLRGCLALARSSVCIHTHAYTPE